MSGKRSVSVLIEAEVVDAFDKLLDAYTSRTSAIEDLMVDAIEAALKQAEIDAEQA